MTIYTDRYGKEHIPPEGAALKTREGAFTVCINKGCVLLQWEDYAPNVADLPGGGMDAGENEFQAAAREFFEETGMIYPFNKQDISGTYRQIVQYYADVDNEYWAYTQTYFLIEKDEDSIFFEGELMTAENGKMRWVKLEDVSNILIHAMHKKGYEGLKGKI
ncbi:MAG: hypothetical protein A3J37_01880 [Alphaproteobacteria bacterium RIFCSPHIGHO2_12_FULL_45_9]|nr:MAG: hypothetical protein A3J37_01880 [Alphaproteobacteria bacterium RIFCSPHIGHO2_12_FULL_45_9]